MRNRQFNGKWEGNDCGSQRHIRNDLNNPIEKLLQKYFVALFLRTVDKKSVFPLRSDGKRLRIAK
jgi:hypothetical protein